MSEKSTRYGKYLGKKAGVVHHLHPKGWGDKRYFMGSQLKVYVFRNPETGVEWRIHAPNEATAQAQAKTRGLVQYRKQNRKKRSSKKGK